MHVPYDKPATSQDLDRIGAEFDHHDCAIQFALARNRRGIPA
jgi:hypothetical protein